MSTPTEYRKNVAIVVLNEEGLILACERSDVPNAWQLPQGGVEKGESLLEAMKRELLEEIGTEQIEIIGQLSEPIRYDWPDHLYSRGYLGQEQYYFLVRLAADAVINFDLHQKEFSSSDWLGAKDFLSRVQGFKANAYSQAIEQLSRFFPGVIRD